MYKVLYNKKISSNSFEMAIEAPLVIEKAIPGQFVIVMSHEDSERIPLTIYDYDKEAFKKISIGIDKERISENWDRCGISKRDKRNADNRLKDFYSLLDEK